MPPNRFPEWLKGWCISVPQLSVLVSTVQTGSKWPVSNLGCVLYSGRNMWCIISLYVSPCTRYSLIHELVKVKGDAAVVQRYTYRHFTKIYLVRASNCKPKLKCTDQMYTISWRCKSWHGLCSTPIEAEKMSRVCSCKTSVFDRCRSPVLIQQTLKWTGWREC